MLYMHIIAVNFENITEKHKYIVPIKCVTINVKADIVGCYP